MVKLRKYRRRGAPTGHWEVDVRVELPNGEVFRQRVIYRDSPSKVEARAWAGEREHHVKALARQGLDLEAIRRALKGTKEEGPTLASFWPDFIQGYANANREKYSTVRSRQSIYDAHLLPRWGTLPLSSITDEEVQKLKGALADRSPKTVNNVLVCLSVLLKAAVEWRRLAAMPCRIRLVKVLKNTKPDFYDDAQLARLVAAATASSRTSDLVTVLLGADAGLRRGEVLGLEWTDVDFGRGTLTVKRAMYRGVTGTPKGGAERTIPLTARLKAALRAHRHLAGPRVLSGASDENIRSTMERLSRRAGLPAGTRMKRGKEVPRWLGLYHKLRHTFCTRLAMTPGVTPRTIQALAGHVSIETTMRYMHVAAEAPAEAIRALDARAGGGGVEARSGAEEKPKETEK